MSTTTSNGDARTFMLDLKAPHTVYKNASKSRLPGVTTVLGVLAKPALIKWAAEVEREGVLRCLQNDDPIPSGLFFEIQRDRAADTGTIAHAMAEAWLKGGSLNVDGLPMTQVDDARHAFERFREWWTARGLTIMHSEIAMVSENWQVGGTADVIARDERGHAVLIDLKTTKPSRYWPYDETFAQVAAYAEMYREVHVTEIRDLFIVRIGKTADDEIQVHEVSGHEREAGLVLFDAALKAYRAKNALKRGAA